MSPVESSSSIPASVDQTPASATLELISELAEKHWKKSQGKWKSSNKRKKEDPPSESPKKKPRGKGGKAAQAKQDSIAEDDGEDSQSEDKAVVFDPALVESIWKEHLESTKATPAKISSLEFNQYFEHVC
jgi:hypothetical protein